MVDVLLTGAQLCLPPPRGCCCCVCVCASARPSVPDGRDWLHLRQKNTCCHTCDAAPLYLPNYCTAAVRSILIAPTTGPSHVCVCVCVCSCHTGETVMQSPPGVVSSVDRAALTVQR
jgi:hypothetical protein